MPDIDIDFSVKGRERVIRYVAEKYGQESVAQIVTFGRMFPRAATRDAAGCSASTTAPGTAWPSSSPTRSWAARPLLRGLPQAGGGARPRVRRGRAGQADRDDLARGLEGTVRNAGVHAAAVVIADRPLTDIVPLQIAEDAGRGGRTAARPTRRSPSTP